MLWGRPCSELTSHYLLLAASCLLLATYYSCYLPEQVVGRLGVRSAARVPEEQDVLVEHRQHQHLHADGAAASWGGRLQAMYMGLQAGAHDTTDATPDATPGTAPNATPDATPDATSEPTPDANPATTPGARHRFRRTTAAIDPSRKVTKRATMESGGLGNCAGHVGTVGSCVNECVGECQ